MLDLEEYFKEEETLVTVELIPFKRHREKFKHVNEHIGKSSIEILDDKYVYVIKLEGDHAREVNQSEGLQSY